MGVSTKTRSTFGDKLRAELNRQGLSLRGLGRRMDPEVPERARRNLSRWVSDTNPTRPTPDNRAAVAVALGVDPSYFDEEVASV